MSGNFCPVSGLPIFSKPEWSDIKVCDDYYVSFQKIGDYILNQIPYGDMKQFDSDAYYDIHKKIVNEAFESGIKYLDLKDYSNLKGKVKFSERIKVYHQLTLNQHMSHGFIVYNCPKMVNLIYRALFSSVNTTPSFNMKVAADYPSAIKLAIDILKCHKNDDLFLKENGFFQRDQWTYNSADNISQIKIMLSNENIMFIKCSGILGLQDMEFFQNTLHNILEDKLLSNDCYIIVDLKSYKHSDLAFRQYYVEFIQKLIQEFNISPKTVYFCSVNNTIKASLLFSVPFPDFEFVYDISEALNLIRIPDLQKKRATDVSVPIKDINSLVNKIGSIAWGNDDVSSTSIETSSPLKYVEDALSLIHNDQNEIIAELNDRNAVLKRVVKELKDANTKAESAIKAKDAFLSNMSHELRTPLNGIIGMTDILKESQLSDEQKLTVDMIQQSGKNLLFLINDILDHIKIESGNMILEKSNVSCDKLLQEVANMVAYQAYQKNLPIIIDISPTIYPLFSGDALRIKQILLNFLSNAIKFTTEGYISINVNEISDNPTYQDISFEIKDTGIGIDNDKLDMIFELFTQIDSSVTRKYGGTGLGLNIAKKLITLMNGATSVSSEPGKGSLFQFSIPLTKAFFTPAKEFKDLKNIRALIFSEIDEERDWYAKHLNDIGCNVDFSGNFSSDIQEYLNKLKDNVSYQYIALFDPGFSSWKISETIYRKLSDIFPVHMIKYILLWNSTTRFETTLQIDSAIIIKKPVLQNTIKETVYSLLNN